METFGTFLLIIGIVAMFSPAAIIIFISYKKAGIRKADVKELSAHYENELEGCLHFPIRYASTARFNKIWKLFTWEDSGILVIREKDITFLRTHGNNLVFPFANVQIEWIGTKYWPNGVVAWFVLRENAVNHYFTSDTGTWATQSIISTQQIYDVIEAKRRQVPLDDS
ncbi:MAG: hypothetical protein JXJ04_13910 [Spirochaetales bacterium]|nr:hypothetical protein [Spirochaetales bacterium]